MLIGQFITILYNKCGHSTNIKKGEYFLHLINNLISNPNIDNPFSELNNDTLSRYFNLKTNRVNPEKLKLIRGRIHRFTFEDYINHLSTSSQESICDELKEYFTNVDEDDIGFYCGQLFIKLIDDTIAGTATPSEKLPRNYVPMGNVYLDSSSGLLHIGANTLKLPPELIPPEDIAPKEGVYVDKLLAAYADVDNADTLTKAEINTLHPRYLKHLKEQRINYYKADRINRFCRESLENGDIHFNTWKNHTYDYIYETYDDFYDNGYRRLKSVLDKVVDSTTPADLEKLDSLIGPREKKGVCHFLASEETFHWVDIYEQNI